MTSTEQDKTRTLTASGAPARRHPDRVVDSRGVVIGPWSIEVQQANAALRRAAGLRRR